SVGDLEEAIRSEEAHVTGVEPAVAAQHLSGGVRLAVVALHHVGTPGDDLAIRSDPHFHSWNRPAHRSEPKMLEGVDRDDRRRLRESIAFEDWHAGGVEESGDVGRQRRAARYKETDPPSGPGPQLGEHQMVG